MSNAAKKQQKTVDQTQAKNGKAQQPKGPKPDYTPKKKNKPEVKAAPVQRQADKSQAPREGAVGMALLKACQDAGTSVQYRKTAKPEQEQRKPRPPREANANKPQQRTDGKSKNNKHSSGNKKHYGGKPRQHQQPQAQKASGAIGVIPVKPTEVKPVLAQPIQTPTHVAASATQL